MQLKDLNSGTFGFVQLALDKTTGRQVAIKFIERGDKVQYPSILYLTFDSTNPVFLTLSALKTFPHLPNRFLPPFLMQVTKYVEREILNHRQLVHPHIVQFKEVFLTTKYLAIAMEYAAGGDMFEYVVRKGGLRESESRWFFQQLIVATDYIHRMVSNGKFVEEIFFPHFRFRC